ncbi:hypothetical protein Ahy_B09g095889 isoform F [Arachis hypogaea]|uniref:VWFA domain-containing protein n=1 Tax=Arachis hypogaea TaxID=3818 RepID=A0A444XGY9_ARAHY|nr:hypothetical protein Ahy_B09g095889 isoform F [Arachis hypogaea]
MANQFSSSVDFGLRLSRRIYYGQGSAPVPAMSRSPEEYLPTAPMCYAVISDPDTVDNPDIRSYQPYVHGKCDPPALIPLQLLGVTMEVDCSLDTAFVTVNARWRVHCVLGSSTCDCRLAIPMGEQGSLLGVEVDNFGRSYHTELISRNDENDKEKVAKAKDGYFLKSQIYIIDIPQFSGGSIFSIKIKWSQEILFNEGQFSLNIPFSFPSYVNPIGIKSPKKERILLKVNSGAAREVSCNTSSHPLKVLMRQAGKLSLSYEAEVQAWSSIDFSLSYIVSLTDIVGGVLLQSPFLRDFDEREIFCLYLYPGKSQDRKVFRKNVVFIVDISGSMKGSPLESTKNALIASLSHLNAQDTFNIIAFNGEFYSFSGLMEPATVEKLLSATKWVEATFIANGGTNILNPLTQAMKLFQNSTASDSIPLIFLVTDGTVENERQICNFVKSCPTNGQPVRTPRLCTLGIGLYCNHYFLQMLAQLGRGHYDAAYDLDSISFRMQRLFRTASSVIVSDITLGGLGLDSVEILAKRHMDLVTSQAWLLESAELVEKVSKMSIQHKLPSEYTCMVLVENSDGKKAPEPMLIKRAYSKLSRQRLERDSQKLFLGGMSLGFGDLKATANNVSPAIKEAKPSEGLLEKATSTCCGRFADNCCGMCLLQTCRFANDQCTIVCTQLCAALACFELINCCIELCDCDCL